MARKKLEIAFNGSIAFKKRTPLCVFYPDNRYILIDYKVNKEFINGKYTEKILSHSYECVEIKNYKHIIVKVEGSTPLLPLEELKASKDAGKNTWVRFVNATLLPYISESTQSIEDSIKADAIEFVDDIL